MWRRRRRRLRIHKTCRLLFVIAICVRSCSHHKRFAHTPKMHTRCSHEISHAWSRRSSVLLQSIRSAVRASHETTHADSARNAPRRRRRPTLDRSDRWSTRGRCLRPLRTVVPTIPSLRCVVESRNRAHKYYYARTLLRPVRWHLCALRACVRACT